MATEEQIVELLSELVKWTKVGFHSSVKSCLESVLTDDKKRQAYSLADGIHTADEIRKTVETSPNKITDLFRGCEAMGLMSITADGKRKALFNLADFGLTFDPLPSKKDTK